MTKRGERLARPADPDKWELRAGDSAAASGWDELCRTHPHAARTAYDALQRTPRARSERQFPLQGSLAARAVRGLSLEQWQYEITGSGRLFYCIDVEKQTLWITHAATGHPKVTEKRNR